MHSIKVIKAQEENLENITPLFDKYMVFYKKPSNIIVHKQYLKERIQNKEAVIFLAIDSTEKAVGFALNYYSFSSVSLGRTLILNDLYVDKNYRNQGIGKQLIKTVFDFAKNTKAIRVDLETGLENKTAQRLYEKIGFQKEEEALHYSYSL